MYTLNDKPREYPDFLRDHFVQKLPQASAVLLRRGPSTKTKYRAVIGEYLVRFGGDYAPAGCAPVAVISIDGNVTVIDPGYAPSPDEVDQVVRWIYTQLADVTDRFELRDLILSQPDPADYDLNDRIRAMVLKLRPADRVLLHEELSRVEGTAPARIAAALAVETDELLVELFHSSTPAWVRVWALRLDPDRSYPALAKAKALASA